jgi:hypothetical protein
MHVHYNLIMEWAKGAEIEYEEAPGVFIKTLLPNWHPGNTYRIHDPYRELKEAAKDPNKEIRLAKDKNGVPYGDDCWHSGDYWQFTEAPDRYAIRDKPKTKKKVLLWQWVLKDTAGRYFTTCVFYPNEEAVAEDFSSKIVGIAPWTEIEVEE